MDTVEVDVARLEAGAAYLKALRSFGLEPEGLFWARDNYEDRLILMLVSRYFDIVGPLALSTLLFKAYEASATPREVDPFIVRLHSPDHHMIRTMIEALDEFKKQVVEKKGVRVPPGATFGNESVMIPLEHIYVWKDVRRPGVDLLRKWNFIEKKVDALAAA